METRYMNAEEKYKFFETLLSELTEIHAHASIYGSAVGNMNFVGAVAFFVARGCTAQDAIMLMNSWLKGDGFGKAHARRQQITTERKGTTS